MSRQFKTQSLTPEAKNIIINKYTEPPLNKCKIFNQKDGTYLCRNCGKGLFDNSNRFYSECGWPSFDDEINNTIYKSIDNDGVRIEITCRNCQSHLGHIFYGENFTDNNQRYCVNSLSLDFVEQKKILVTEEAILAAGCFWGVEYYFKKLVGVLKIEVGYIGGNTENPTYNSVCNQDKADHVEAIRILYNPSEINYEQIIKYFFEIHNFSQVDGQGPDIGPQYLSQIFCYPDQFKIAQNIIDRLKSMNYLVATTLRDIEIFWQAEDFHQNYYVKTKQVPYCHKYIKIF